MSYSSSSKFSGSWTNDFNTHFTSIQFTCFFYLSFCQFYASVLCYWLFRVTAPVCCRFMPSISTVTNKKQTNVQPLITWHPGINIQITAEAARGRLICSQIVSFSRQLKGLQQNHLTAVYYQEHHISNKYFVEPKNRISTWRLYPFANWPSCRLHVTINSKMQQFHTCL